MSNASLEKAFETASSLRRALSSVILGRQDTIDLVLTALFADGHVLLEDYPGSGKTTLAKTLGRLIDCSSPVNSPSGRDEHILPFRRIQFTPDMLPGDVLGVNIFDAKSSSFRFIHGPVFAHIVLADELNRTGPKVQSAFLECMAEKQVTIDNITYPLDELFFVIGTQNPLDLAGTYPLPQVQLDRFLCRIPMSYVDPATELHVLEKEQRIKELASSIAPVVSRNDIIQARRASQAIIIRTELRQAIVDTVQLTRNNPLIQFGASTRAAIMLQSALLGWAIVQGRDFITEDDLVHLAPFVLLHRLRFHPGAGEPREALRQLMAVPLEKLVSTVR